MLRFYLDNDVDAACRNVLQTVGECWGTNQAGRTDAPDDEQAIYAADRGAVLVTHDREFTERRKRSVWGQHIRLCVDQPDGPEVLARYLSGIVEILTHCENVVIEVFHHQCRPTFTGWT